MKARHHVLLVLCGAAIGAAAVSVLTGVSATWTPEEDAEYEKYKTELDAKLRATAENVHSSITTTLIPADMWPDMETMLDDAIHGDSVERSPGKRVIKTDERWNTWSTITVTAQERIIGEKKAGVPYTCFEVCIQANVVYSAYQLSVGEGHSDWRGSQIAADREIDLPTCILNRLRRFGVSKNHAKPDATTPPPVLDVERAYALRPYSGQRVTLRGTFYNSGKGRPYMSGKDVLIQVSPAPEPFEHDVENKVMELTGNLEFVHESRWRTSVGDDPNIGSVQDYGSGQDPITFILHLDK